jgi:hypothetical protein
MTEAEWVACTDPQKMLGHLKAKKVNRSRCGRRKLRLFACACVRGIVRLLSERGRVWLGQGERYAGGCLTRDERRLFASQPLYEGVEGPNPESVMSEWWAAREAELAAWFTLRPNVMSAAEGAARSAAHALEIETLDDHRRVREAERKQQVALLRDIFGNPFRPVALDSGWLTPGVVELARTIYEDRAFERVPDLADA